MTLRRKFIIIVASILLILGMGRLMTAQGTAGISGLVVNDAGPVAGATVRVRNTTTVTSTDAAGRFTLDGLTAGETVEITAWLDGYYISYVTVTPPVTDVVLTLRPYHTVDHLTYEWVSPLPGDSRANSR